MGGDDISNSGDGLEAAMFRYYCKVVLQAAFAKGNSSNLDEYGLPGVILDWQVPCINCHDCGPRTEAA